jgi:hypothetical protein
VLSVYPRFNLVHNVQKGQKHSSLQVHFSHKSVLLFLYHSYSAFYISTCYTDCDKSFRYEAPPPQH